MDAEAALLRGRFADAAIFLERARAAIAGNGQENMALCCDFLERRLALCAGTASPESPAQKRAALLAQHDTMWLRIFDSACAYCAALTGQVGQVPALFREHALHTVHFLAPCRPMMEMIENQVYLAEGAYARVIGRSEGLLAQCAQQHYALVALHVRIQTGRCLRRARASGRRRAASSARRCARQSPTVCCCRSRKTAAACAPCWPAARGRRTWAISRSGQRAASQTTRRAAPRCARPTAALRRSPG